MKPILGILTFFTFVPVLLLSFESANQTIDTLYLLVFAGFVLILTGSYIYLKKKKNTIAKSDKTESKILKQQEENETFINYLKASQLKPEIEEELFRLNYFLKELYSLLEEDIYTQKVEFLYDIDKNVPVEIVGDAVLYKQIFYHILSNLFQYHDIETLIFTIHLLLEEDQKYLIFEISLIHKDDTEYTAHKYNFEYVQELLTLIGGKLFSYPWVDKKKRFQVKIPFIIPEHTQLDFYKLPKEITQLSILLVEEKTISTEVYKKIFKNFNISVNHIAPANIYQTLEHSHYDIVILDMDEYPMILQQLLSKEKQKYGSKIIALENTFDNQQILSKDNRLIDKFLNKPLTPGTIHDFLFESYTIKTEAYEISEQSTQADTTSLQEDSQIQRENFKVFGHTHVLIVEDNKINQKILENILTQSDLEVSVANHGAEALEILNNEKDVDLVLMDINMPVMDGYEATRRIRQIKKYKYLPIVVISGLGYRNEIEKMYHIGVNAHLSKPFKIEELYEVFENVLLTEQENNTSQSSEPQGYQEDKSILNTTKGLFLQKNVFQFRDMLGEMMHRFYNAPEHVETLLIKESYTELSNYLNTLYEESEDIGAEAIKELVYEMKILSDKKEEALLKTYLPHFNDIWRDTLRQIRSYLENSRK